MVLEKTLESPLDCKIKPVNPKGNQSWIFIGRIDAEADTPILWPPDSKKWLTGKDPDAGKDWGQEEKGTTEYEVVGWHHLLDGHEFEQAPGACNGQGSLVCCSPWGHKESETAKWLNWTELNIYVIHCLFIWLPWVLVVAPGIFGLCWGMGDLLVVSRGIQFPNHGSNPGPLHWEQGIFTTGPPEKSLGFLLLNFSFAWGFKGTKMTFHSLSNPTPIPQFKLISMCILDVG